jgi:hypothetical protein
VTESAEIDSMGTGCPICGEEIPLGAVHEHPFQERLDAIPPRRGAVRVGTIVRVAIAVVVLILLLILARAKG